MNTALLKVRGWIRGPWWEPAAYCALVAVAAAMRLWDLGSRALHHDESLHSFYSWQLYSRAGSSRALPYDARPVPVRSQRSRFLRWWATADFTAVGWSIRFAAGIGPGGVCPSSSDHRMGRVLAPCWFPRRCWCFPRPCSTSAASPETTSLMAVWTLGLVIAMWRYLDEGKNRGTCT